jgi:ArsR family transcriptional regulator, arsenate/arsenite/antimonite-responsive transcriptional repressor
MDTEATAAAPPGKRPAQLFDISKIVVDSTARRAHDPYRGEHPMDGSQAVKALAALAQETRLAAFRMLVQAGPAGCPAGTLAERLKVPPTTLSFHLAQLLGAGLVTQRRQGRQLIYATTYEAMNGLVAYLTENCCGRGAVLTLCRAEPSSSIRENQHGND